MPLTTGQGLLSRIKSDDAAEVFKSFRGSDIEVIEGTFIRRTIITVAQNTAGQMSLSEVISAKRNELQDNVQKSLLIELQKMAAQQQAQQAEYELQKQQMLAKAEVAKAEGEAQSTLNAVHFYLGEIIS